MYHLAVMIIVVSLLRQHVYAAAGFPDVCQNVDKIVETINGTESEQYQFFLKNPNPSQQCTFDGEFFVCNGTPEYNQCFLLDGETIQHIYLFMGDSSILPEVYIDSINYVSLIITLLIIIIFGPLSDFGTIRYTQVYLYSFLGNICIFLVPFLPEDDFLHLSIIEGITTISYFSAMIHYFTLLPILSKSHREYDKASYTNRIQSNTSIFFSYRYDFSISKYVSCICGLWGILLTLFSMCMMPRRQGKDLPANIKRSGLLFYAIKRYGITFSNIGALPNVVRILCVSTFITGPMYYVISIVISFYDNYMRFVTMESSLYIVFIYLFASIMSMFGNVLFTIISHHKYFSAISILMVTQSISLIVYLYMAVVVFLQSDILFNSKWLGVFFFLLFFFFLGPQRAYIRSLFSIAIPEGHEAEFFVIFFGVLLLGYLVNGLVASICDIQSSNNSRYGEITPFADHSSSSSSTSVITIIKPNPIILPSESATLLQQRPIEDIQSSSIPVLHHKRILTPTPPVVEIQVGAYNSRLSPVTQSQVPSLIRELEEKEDDDDNNNNERKSAIINNNMNTNININNDNNSNNNTNNHNHKDTTILQDKNTIPTLHVNVPFSSFINLSPSHGTQIEHNIPSPAHPNGSLDATVQSNSSSTHLSTTVINDIYTYTQQEPLEK
ncbi:hypothetical protein WA158_006573 [Blastocystis sp. Blastoise]